MTLKLSRCIPPPRSWSTVCQVRIITVNWTNRISEGSLVSLQLRCVCDCVLLQIHFFEDADFILICSKWSVCYLLTSSFIFIHKQSTSLGNVRSHTFTIVSGSKLHIHLTWLRKQRGYWHICRECYFHFQTLTTRSSFYSRSNIC